jgi:hypothetical protein
MTSVLVLSLISMVVVLVVFWIFHRSVDRWDPRRIRVLLGAPDIRRRSKEAAVDNGGESALSTIFKIFTTCLSCRRRRQTFG